MNFLEVLFFELVFCTGKNSDSLRITNQLTDSGFLTLGCEVYWVTTEYSKVKLAQLIIYVYVLMHWVIILNPFLLPALKCIYFNAIGAREMIGWCTVKKVKWVQNQSEKGCSKPLDKGQSTGDKQPFQLVKQCGLLQVH